MPDNTSGYGIAVNSDISSLKCSLDDYYIFISDEINAGSQFPNSLILRRNNIFFRLFNVLFRGHPSFFSSLYIFLRFFIKFQKYNFHSLFIGDINFYGIQYYFKSEKKILRMHNVYLKMQQNLIYIKSRDYFKLYYEVLVGARIERAAIKYIKNKKMEILCITEQERDFLNKRYNLCTGWMKIFKCVNQSSTKHKEEHFTWDNKIVWFGGLSSHKLLSMSYFVENIYPEIKKKNSNIKFELYGKGTVQFSNPNLNIMGFGYINSFEFKDYSNSIFINPDIIGGGIKLKLNSYIEHNLVVLSTPLGIEGFSKLDFEGYCFIEEISNWAIFFEKLSLNETTRRY